VKLTEKHNFVMGSIVAFQRSEDNIKLSFKEQFDTIVKKFIFDAKKAE